MKSRLFITGLAITLALGGREAVSQDVVVVFAGHCSVKVENPHVRVVECAVKPGEKVALHTNRAGWYYVTMSGKLKSTYAGGKEDIWEPPVGDSGWMEADPPHTSENVGDTAFGMILVEVKSATLTPGKPTKK